MARRSLEDRHIRKLTKTGSSVGVTIPIEMLRDLGWRTKQKVVITQRGDQLIIKDWKG